MINQQKVLEVLKDAREILADEQRWTKNDFTLDAGGKPTNTLGPDAARWCIMGAVIRAGATTSRIDEGTEALKLLKAEVRRTTGD